MVAVLNADKSVRGTKPIILPLTSPSQLVAATPSGLMTRTDEWYWQISLPMTNEFSIDRITECNKVPYGPFVNLPAIDGHASGL